MVKFSVGDVFVNVFIDVMELNLLIIDFMWLYGVKRVECVIWIIVLVFTRYVWDRAW